MKLNYLLIICMILGCCILKKEEAKNFNLMGCGTELVTGNKKAVDSCINLPPSLKDYIAKELKQYSIPDTIDYVSIWHDFTEKNSLPYIACSDFNNDGSIDYALVLKKSESNKVFLCVFNSIEKGFVNYQLDEYEIAEKGIETVISIEKKGKWESIDTSITVINDGILVKLIEESLSCSFYWDGHKYKAFLYD